MARGRAQARARRADERADPDPRRERHRQGSRRARDPLEQPARRASRTSRVNCAAIPETLLESILFGHVKGAFTGASFHKVGEFQKANGGTLFLDEVGELPVMLQAKVLRAVEQGEVQPLGSNEPPDRVDVRLICATNRDLEAMAKTGAFRDDLFYRLSVMTLELPPLRSYKDNLEMLANVFLEQSAAAHGKPAPRLGPAVLARLAAYDFPGNVRELKNTIEHAMILCTGDELRLEDLPRPLLDSAPRAARAPASRPSRRSTRRASSWLDPLERQYLTDLLAKHGGNVKTAARRPASTRSRCTACSSGAACTSAAPSARLTNN